LRQYSEATMSRENDDELHPAAVERIENERLEKVAALRRGVGGWVLMCGGLVYAFQFQSATGWVVCAVGAGILSIKDAKTLLGK
jgi:hypothetical protein